MSEEILGDIPQVDDGAVATVAEAPKPKATRKKRGRPAHTVIKGEDLKPDMDAYTRGVDTEVWFCVGLLPGAPVQGVDIAGISWPKTNAELVPVPGRENMQRHQKVIGALVKLTESKIRLLREKIPRTVLRFDNPDEMEEDAGVGWSISDVMRGSGGKVISIPSREEIKELVDKNLPTRQYVRSSADVAAADYLFAVMCTNQDRPRHVAEYPEPVSVTGLKWPGKVSDA